MKVTDKQNYTIENVHISEIQTGDTILHTDGKIRTVCRNDIKEDPFIGLHLFGDTYLLGTKPVKRIKFIIPTAYGIVNR